MITQGKWEVYSMLTGTPMIIRRKKAGLTVITKLFSDETSPDKDEQLDNAHLIAAAPSLLSALQSLCDAERQVEQHGQKDAGGYLETELVRAEDLLETLDI